MFQDGPGHVFPHEIVTATGDIIAAGKIGLVDRFQRGAFSAGGDAYALFGFAALLHDHGFRISLFFVKL